MHSSVSQFWPGTSWVGRCLVEVSCLTVPLRPGVNEMEDVSGLYLDYLDISVCVQPVPFPGLSVTEQGSPLLCSSWGQMEAFFPRSSFQMGSGSFLTVDETATPNMPFLQRACHVVTQ